MTNLFVKSLNKYYRHFSWSWSGNENCLRDLSDLPAIMINGSFDVLCLESFHRLHKKCRKLLHFGLVLLQVPKCFGLVQNFCARPKICLHIVAVTNILCETKRWFAFSKIVFLCRHKSFRGGTKCSQMFGLAQTFDCI